MQKYEMKTIITDLKTHLIYFAKYQLTPVNILLIVTTSIDRSVWILWITL